MTAAQPAFDPHAAGTREAEWATMLRSAPAWEPPRKALLVISPHPDDEVLGAGGLISACSAAGDPVTILSVTDGEAAHSWWPHLDLVRRKELRAAVLALTSTHVQIRRLGIPDGKVPQHANRLRGVLQEMATPDVTLIAPHPDDGHPDHEIVGSLCREVARDLKVPVATYPIWAWHHRAPAEMNRQSWCRFALPEHARRAKLRAIECFASQMRPPRGRPIVPGHVLKHFQRRYEAFVL